MKFKYIFKEGFTRLTHEEGSLPKTITNYVNKTKKILFETKRAWFLNGDELMSDVLFEISQVSLALSYKLAIFNILR